MLFLNLKLFAVIRAWFLNVPSLQYKIITDDTLILKLKVRVRSDLICDLEYVPQLTDILSSVGFYELLDSVKTDQVQKIIIF